MRKLILATRGSKLALVQANMVKDMLESRGAQVEINIVHTKGDRDRQSPLQQIGGKGLFVKEIELALASGEADIAVHSGKDLPYVLMEGMTIAANPRCADPRDCLVTRKGETLSPTAVIGTGSPRRIVQCRRFYPDARYTDIRGNVDTRLRKLKDGDYDGIFLARAGMDRLGIDLSDFDVRVFESSEIIPAACQGILAVECRENDTEVVSLLSQLNDEETRLRFMAERRAFCSMEADCSMAVAAHAEVSDGRITVDAMYCGKYYSGSCTEESMDTLIAELKAAIL